MFNELTNQRCTPDACQGDQSCARGMGAKFFSAASALALTLGAPAALAQAPVTIEQRDRDDADSTIDTVIVTGTNIRGAAPKSSPVVVIDAEALARSGFATIGDYFEFLPQNFASLGDDGQFGATGSDGPAINLRGLGANETLVLINGQRVASSTTSGSFVDLSQIPATAVERIEILLDGASAVYGADAVAGVVNIILKTDAEGLLVNMRYGTVTDGGLREYRASATGGVGWESGNLSLSYEFFDRAELLASDRDFVVPAAQFDLIPGETRHSFAAFGRQNLSDAAAFSLNALVSFEDSQPNTSSIGLLQENDIQRNLYWVGADLAGSALGFDYNLEGSYSFRNNDIINTSQSSRSARFSDLRSETSVYSIDGRLSRSLLPLPGGAALIGIGGGFREEEIQFRSFDAAGAELLFINEKRTIYYGYGEVSLPFISPKNNIAFVNEFEINASVRHEDFENVGGSTNPKIGAVWAPVDGLRFRGSYGTSFRAPELQSLNGNNGADVLDIGAVFGATPFPELGDNVALLLGGSNPDLQPQESRSFSVGADYASSFLEGLNITLNYFDIEYDEQIGAPITVLGAFDALVGARGQIFYTIDPSQEFLEDIINQANRASSFVPGVDINDPSTFEAINLFFDGRQQNTSKSSARGLDFNITYDFSHELGDFALGLSGTYLFKNAFAITEDEPLIDNVDTSEDPVDLQFRANVGYSRGGFTSSLFVNYIDSYTNDLIADPVKIDSWTTVDLSLAYDFSESPGMLNKSQIRVSAQNLFDSAPPKVEGAMLIGSGIDLNYDAANASPRGRFVAIELTKQF